MLDSGWATARVAPTRASSPSCSRRGDACRRPWWFPDGLVRVGTDAARARDATAYEGRSRAGFGMGDREGRPYAGSSPSCSRRGDACRRPWWFADGLVRVGTDAARAWDATSYEGNEAVLDSGWATARVAPTRASSPSCSRRGDACRRPWWFPDGLVRVGTDAARARDATSYEGTKPCWIRDGRPRGSPLRGPRRRVVRVGATLVVAHACRRLQGAPSPMPVSPMASFGSVRTPQGRGTPPRTKETKPCWIRDGRPRGSPLRGPRRRVVRVGATLVVAHACRRLQGAPFPTASFGSVRTPQGRGTPPRTKETKPCWIRDGRPRGSPLRGPR